MPEDQTKREGMRTLWGRLCKTCGAVLTLHELPFGRCDRCVLTSGNFSQKPAIELPSLPQRIYSKDEAVRISQASPLLLLWYKGDLPGEILFIASGRGLVVGDIVRSVKGARDFFLTFSGSNDLIDYLKSENIWFEGCWIMDDGKIVKHERFKFGWLGPRDVQVCDFVRQFVAGYSCGKP